MLVLLSSPFRRCAAPALSHREREKAPKAAKGDFSLLRRDKR